MRDTLQHLVKATVNRRDSNKFLYILNQIDVTANEDNLEEVYAAWQRALAQYGLTAGSSYAIYNQDVAIPFEDENVRARFESKHEADSSAIYNRIEQVSVERAYRIVGMLEQTSHMMKQDVVPILLRFIDQWRHKILWVEGVIVGALVVAFMVLTIWGGYWEGLSLKLPFWDLVTQNNYIKYGAIGILLIAAGYVHFNIRRWSANKIIHKLLLEVKNPELHPNFQRAFQKTSRWWRSLFWPNPAGWGKSTAARLEKVLDDSNAYIQKLNDEYTNPSGKDKIVTEYARQASGGSPQSDLTRDESATARGHNTGPFTSDN
jgi:hypothetical protein